MSGRTIMEWVWGVGSSWLVVDLLSGIVHWLEDTYGSPDTPILGKYVIAPNIDHHFHPRAFLASSLWERNHVLWPGLVALAAIMWLNDALSPFGLSLLAWGSISGEAHVWAHRSERENGRIITGLQYLRILQTRHHHAKHHTDPKRQGFCALTNALNPILDGCRVFRLLERIGTACFGVQPRPDLSVRHRQAERT